MIKESPNNKGTKGRINSSWLPVINVTLVPFLAFFNIFCITSECVWGHINFRLMAQPSIISPTKKDFHFHCV